MTTTTCPGCHGAGTEMSGTTHAGLAEHLACDECGPDCPQDCGCRVDDAAEHHEFVALCHSGVTQSPSGYPSDPPPLKGPQNRVERDRYGLILTEPERALLDGISGTFPETALVGIVDRLVGEVERLGGSRLVDAIAAQARAEEVDRLTAERDRARGLAVALEAELARLREGIEALADEWHQAYDPDPIVLTNRMRAADLRALLADTDSAKAEGGE